MSRGRVLGVVYYGGLSLALALILLRALPRLLPHSLAGEVGRNSEGLLVLLMVSAWIEFVRSRREPAPRLMTLALVTATAWVVIGLLLRYGPVPSQLSTLNEAAFALAILIPYLQLRRPLPTWAWIVPMAAVAIPLVGGSNSVTTDLAEAFGALVLIPLCVDAVDPGILDGSVVPLIRVLTWMGLLLAFLVLVHQIVDLTPVGFAEQLVRYLSRVNEMFIAALLLHAYFSLLRPDLRTQRSSVSLTR